MSGELVVERSDAIAFVTINRPEVRNALSAGLCQRLTATIAALGAEAAVRVIVLRGAGDKVFVSGADVREFREKLATAEGALQYDEIAEALAQAIEAVPKPVIAEIQGYAVGSGCLVAMACDLRIASDRARFGIPTARIGLVASIADTARLVRLVGMARAKWLLLTGGLIEAEAARQAGLVNEIVSFDRLGDRVREIAGTLAANAPLSMKAGKQMVAAAAGPLPGIAEGLRWYREVYGSRDFAEGIDAFFEKRPPRFTGR